MLNPAAEANGVEAEAASTPAVVGGLASVAFEDFYERHRHSVVAYVRGKYPELDNYAEDIAQEAFVRVARHWDDLVTPRAYVTKVARNLAVDALRSRAYEASVDLEMLETLAPEADEDYDSINLMQLIKSAVAGLPARQRSVLLLTATGLQANEIGGHLGVAASTVHVHLHRARVHLQKLLEAEDG